MSTPSAARTLSSKRKYAATGDRKPRDERWAQLLDVAAEIFAEKGYAATSLQEIATRTGILKGSIYYYIKTKEDLLAHLLRETHDKGLRTIRPIAEGKGDPIERLSAMIRAHIEYVCTDRTRTAVFIHEGKRLTHEQRKQFLGEAHGYRSVFQDVITEAQKAGLLRPDVDAKLTALCLLGSLNSLYEWYSPAGEFPVEVIANHFVATSLSGLTVGKTGAKRNSR